MFLIIIYRKNSGIQDFSLYTIECFLLNFIKFSFCFLAVGKILETDPDVQFGLSYP